MKVLVLMAGGDVGFESERYPKNLAEVNGLPMAEVVIRSLGDLTQEGSELVCLVRGDENRQWHTGDVIRLVCESAHVVEVPSETGGAACTALLAISHLEPDDELLIVNGDQVVDAPLSDVIKGFRQAGLDGGLVCFPATHPRWSYARVDERGLVCETAEKRPVSNNATAGTYWFRRGRDFIEGAAEMIRKEAAVGGRYYVCPVYNQLILRDQRIGIARIGADQYHSLADRKGLEAYERRLGRQAEVEPRVR